MKMPVNANVPTQKYVPILTNGTNFVANAHALNHVLQTGFKMGKHVNALVLKRFAINLWSGTKNTAIVVA
jgi:hypothetical protein